MFNYRKFVKKFITASTSACSSQKKKKILSQFIHANFYGPRTDYRKCKDNFVGIISSKNELFVKSEERFFNKKQLVVNRKKSSESAKLVIVMESPHKDEYSMRFVAPAMGNTGNRIDSQLRNLLNSVFCTSEYEVFLVNVIQYQCSLGFDTGLFRDEIFNEMWKNPAVKNSFKQRIHQINPMIIINAATSIKLGKSNLKYEVTNLLKQWQYTVYEASSHPCKWDKNTTLTKK